MYKIKVRDDITGAIWWEYGFSGYIMKRVHYYFNELTWAYYHRCDILDIIIIIKTPKTFIKCLTKHKEYVNI